MEKIKIKKNARIHKCATRYFDNFVLYSQRLAAEKIGVNLNTVRYWIKKNKIDTVEVNERVMIPEWAIILKEKEIKQGSFSKDIDVYRIEGLNPEVHIVKYTQTQGAAFEIIKNLRECNVSVFKMEYKELKKKTPIKIEEYQDRSISWYSEEEGCVIFK